MTAHHPRPHSSGAEQDAVRVLQRVGVETKTFAEQMFPGFTMAAVSDGGRPTIGIAAVERPGAGESGR